MRYAETLKKNTALAAAFALTVPFAATAQDTGTLPPPPLKEKMQQLREDRRENRDDRREVRGEIRDVREGARDDLRDLRANTKEKMKSATSGPERRDILQGARDARKDIRDARASSTAPLKDRLRDLVRERVGLVRDRFQIAITQLENLAARIGTRIEKFKGEGRDTSAAEGALADAKTKIGQARTDAKAVADIVANTSDTDDRKTVRARIDATVKKVHESMKAAREALQKAARELRALMSTGATTGQ